jgi:hypothetical protein
MYRKNKMRPLSTMRIVFVYTQSMYNGTGVSINECIETITLTNR